MTETFPIISVQAALSDQQRAPTGAALIHAAPAAHGEVDHAMGPKGKRPDARGKGYALWQGGDIIKNELLQRIPLSCRSNVWSPAPTFVDCAFWQGGGFFQNRGPQGNPGLDQITECIPEVVKAMQVCVMLTSRCPLYPTFTPFPRALSHPLGRRARSALAHFLSEFGGTLA